MGALRPTFLINIVFSKYERVLFWKPNFDSHHQKYVVWYVTTDSTIVQKLKRERGHYNLQRPPTIVKWTIYVSSEAIIPKSQSTTQGNNHHNKWPLYCTYGVKSRNFFLPRAIIFLWNYFLKNYNFEMRSLYYDIHYILDLFPYCTYVPIFRENRNRSYFILRNMLNVNDVFFLL